jgi:hypothetical protein
VSAVQDKILQSMSRGNEVTVTNDGATILKAVYVDNPAAKVLVGEWGRKDLFWGGGHVVTSGYFHSWAVLSTLEGRVDQQGRHTCLHMCQEGAWHWERQHGMLASTVLPLSFLVKKVLG